MPDLTNYEWRAFKDFLRVRMEQRHHAWNAAKEAQDSLIEMSVDVPYPDGALMRQQASGGAEWAMFHAAVKDHTNMVLSKTWEPGRLEQLIAEWRAERKGPGSERGVRSSEGVA